MCAALFCDMAAAHGRKVNWGTEPPFIFLCPSRFPHALDEARILERSRQPRNRSEREAESSKFQISKPKQISKRLRTLPSVGAWNLGFVLWLGVWDFRICFRAFHPIHKCFQPGYILV